MGNDRIQELIFKFNAQQLTAAEQKEIEKLIEEGKIDLQQLEKINSIDKQIQAMEFPSPAADLDNRFYQMLALEKRSGGSFSWRALFSWPELVPKLAIASMMLLIGIGIGYFGKQVPATSGDEKMKELGEQVASLKEMIMLSLLEKESATERLKAVSLTQEMTVVSSKVTGALLQTLNHDENVNVRLAALDALRPYVKDSSVRQELIRAISRQQSPLVQVALADLMAEIQEKSSVKELEKIIQADQTPAEVKARIKQTIKVLI